GETHTVQEFLEVAFARAGLDPKKHVAFDKGYLRPAEVDLLIGNASKAKKKLGWEPKVRFEQLVEIMVDADIDQLKKESDGKSIRF
ncbi:MAG: GDP-mannose 4,6-dehydratase, partial [Bacteroidetes bacterium]|nr:GDP-mannose 4,6-dehydratase [Bacteroidota bacterium]